MARSLADSLGKKSLASSVGKGLVGVSGLTLKELAALIEHLNLLYIQLESKGNRQKSSLRSNVDIVDIAGKPHVQTRSWNNAGHSKVTESA